MSRLPETHPPVKPTADFGCTMAHRRWHPPAWAASGEVEDHLVNLAAPGVWQSVGPAGATDGQVENIPGRPVSGAVHTVIAHPTNADILYIGATNGGVWRTLNATSASPNWQPLTDDLPSLSIGALHLDLSDPTSQTILAGSGRYSSFGRRGGDRIGLIRSTDGGDSWNVLDGGGVMRGRNVSGIHARGDTIVASVNVADSFTFANIGIFRSTDGGLTFNQISSGNGSATGLPGGASYDLVSDPQDDSVLYTSTVFSDIVGGQNGIYKSSDTGATWTKVSNPAIDTLLGNQTSNLEMATGSGGVVYATIINSGNPTGLFRSGDAGLTWTPMDLPRTNEGGTDVGLNPRGQKGPGAEGTAPEIAGGQGSIHFAIVVDPNDPNRLYVGGDRQPRTNGDTGGFPNSIGARDFTGRLFRGDATAPTGSQWEHLTHSNTLGAAGGGTASSSAPHADSREMTFDANGTLIEVDDGGIYRRTSPTDNTGDWFSLIGNLQVTEAHDVAYDTISNIVITGNQDTGTTEQMFEGSEAFRSVSTADGGDVAVDTISLAGQNRSIRYSSFQNLGSFRARVLDANNNVIRTTFPSLEEINGSPDFDPQFVTPVELNAVDPTRILFGGDNGLYESFDAGDTIDRIASDIQSNSAIAYGGTTGGVSNLDVVYAGDNDGDVHIRTSGTSGFIATDPDPGDSSAIVDLEVDPSDWQNAYSIDSNQVFATGNAGTSWSDVTGNLLALSDGLLRSMQYINGVVDAIAVGTDVGVFTSLVTSLGVWFEIGDALPNAPAFDLDYDAADDVLVVGTLGRGAFRFPAVSQQISPTPTASVVNRSVAYAGATAGYGPTAIADGKSALLPGQPSSTEHYTNYTRGLNRVVIDVADLTSTSLALSDFQFRVGNDDDPANWTIVDGVNFALPVIAVDANVATAGGLVDRVTITFPDNAIRNAWLQVTMRANASTGLATDDVFYFGNQVADVFGATANGQRVRVTSADAAVSRLNQSLAFNSAAIDNVYDLNRDGRVNSIDTVLIRANQQLGGGLLMFTSARGRTADVIRRR